MEEHKARLLSDLILGSLQRQLKQDVIDWLQQKGKLVSGASSFVVPAAAFAMVPAKTGRALLDIRPEESLQITEWYPEFTVDSWSLDKVVRLWLLLQVNDSDQGRYHEFIESLFRNAEMTELAALYACLPVYAFPESWKFQATEGIRSNIGLVLESIMYENPYPYRYLDDQAWNQLVLKAFFTDKDINRIIGIDKRANRELSAILIDYAHERQAAHRMVNPQLWRLVSRFIDGNSIADIEKLYDDPHIMTRRAAVLACAESSYEPAKRLLEKEPRLWEAVKANELTWNAI